MSARVELLPHIEDLLCTVLDMSPSGPMTVESFVEAARSVSPDVEPIDWLLALRAARRSGRVVMVEARRGMQRFGLAVGEGEDDAWRGA